MSLPTLKSSFNTRRNIYEAAIERRRKFDEDYRSKWNQNANYFVKECNKSQMMNKWTSDKSFKNSLNSYLSDGIPDKDKEEFLTQRRKRLQCLYDAELSQNNYELMKLRQPENRKTLEHLRKTAEEYQKINETERLKFADSKFNQLVFENDKNLQDKRRQEDLKKTVGIWGDQVNENEAKMNENHRRDVVQSEIARAEAEKELMFQAELDRLKAERERERVIMLDRQMEELRKSERAAQMLLAEEEQILRQQAIIEQLDTEKKALDAQRVAKTHARALLKQKNAALKRKSQDVQAELERDLSWLQKLEVAAYDEKVLKDEQRKSFEDGLNRARSLVEKDLALERAREAEIEHLFVQEAKEVWTQRESQWIQEAKARETLFEEVLAQRKQQLVDRLAQNRYHQLHDIEERERLLDQLERLRIETDRTKSMDNPPDDQDLRQQNQNIPALCKDVELSSDEKKSRIMEQAYERRLRKDAERLRDQAHSSVIAGRAPNYVYDQLRKSASGSYY